MPPSPSSGPDPLLRLEPVHYALVFAAAAVGITGYWLLDQGSITAAPILLVIAYLVLVPLALVLPARRGRGTDGDSAPDRGKD